MEVFVDTSAFVALIDEDDRQHENAVAFLANVISQRARLVTSNYVVLEAYSLIQRRYGFAALRTFHGGTLPFCAVQRVDDEAHALAVTEVFTQSKRDLSLVDCTSFVLMRRLGISEAFAFDQHFADQGFTCRP